MLHMVSLPCCGVIYSKASDERGTHTHTQNGGRRVEQSGKKEMGKCAKEMRPTNYMDKICPAGLRKQTKNRRMTLKKRKKKNFAALPHLLIEIHAKKKKIKIVQQKILFYSLVVVRLLCRENGGECGRTAEGQPEWAEQMQWILF